jgi:hypothetical protein
MVSDILDSDHLSIVLHLLDRIRIRNLSDSVDKIHRFGALSKPFSELILTRILINLGEEIDEADRYFIATITSAYRLSTSKITLWDFHKDPSGLESPLKHKLSLRKMWKINWDPACKTAVNWNARTIKRMTRKKHSNGGKRN